MLKYATRFLIFSILLVLALPIFAQDGAVIDAGNAFELEELTRLGRGEVFDVQFSPDGSQVIVGSSIGVWIYDATELDTVTEPTLVSTGGEAEITLVNPDGSGMIAVAKDDILKIWLDGEVALEIDTDRYLVSMAFSPDGSVLATGHNNDSIRLWFDFDDDPILLEGHSSDPNDLAFSPDGSILASGSDDDTVRLWDVVEGVELAVIEADVDINVLEFMPDGSTIVTGDDNGVLSAWDAVSGELLIAFEEASHKQAIISMAVSPDGTLVATGSWDNDIRVWNIAEGEQRSVGSGEDAEAWIQPDMGDIRSLQFSPDGSILLVATQDEYVAMYDVDTRDVLAEAVGYNDGMQALSFNPDGTLLTLSDDDGDVWIWTVGSSDEITQIPHMEKIGTFSGDNEIGLTYSPDGSYIVVESSLDVIQIDAVTGETLNVFDGEPFASSVAISPDSTLVAYAGSKGLFIFNAKSGLIVAQINTHTLRANYVEFSPDQTLIATASDDGTVRIYGLID